eukprot:6171447-Prymnesium_polylepis.1
MDHIIIVGAAVRRAAAGQRHAIPAVDALDDLALRELEALEALHGRELDRREVVDRLGSGEELRRDLVAEGHLEVGRLVAAR